MSPRRPQGGDEERATSLHCIFIEDFYTCRAGRPQHRGRLRLLGSVTSAYRQHQMIGRGKRLPLLLFGPRGGTGGDECRTGRCAAGDNSRGHGRRRGTPVAMTTPAAANAAAAPAVLVPKVRAWRASASVEAGFAAASGVASSSEWPSEGRLRSARSKPDRDNLLAASCIWSGLSNRARTSRK